ncbi:MAG: tetratricopeptide repeat protein [Anaerolineales bacterium]|nr:tetratricopeptide repeat protein [Anaerolineales bacterium]MCB8939136.1 tetratricopeptide repeat protein [Ardenticatenaceae bacterium]
MNSDITATTVSYLSRIMEEVHPMMAEALYLAAVPTWFSADLFAAMRSVEDGRNPGLIERLLRYSFVRTLPAAEGESETYAIRPDERVFLQRRWIARDREAYLTAHRRALAYWQQNPDPNLPLQRRLLLYHLLFVDQTAGINHLIDTFRAYQKERQFAEIERLLDTVTDARFYLVVLDEDLTLLDDLLRHMWARVNQMRGLWQNSLETLAELRAKPDLSPLLLPYVVRAHGESLAHVGQFVEAIDAYHETLILFETEEQRLDEADTAVSPPTSQVISGVTDQKRIQIERAYTRLALGDAYVGLADATREHSPPLLPEAPNWLHRLRDSAIFLLSLPLLVYMSFYLGRRVWHPRFWSTLLNLDWIVTRLFVSGAHQYKLADKLLETHGEPAESVAADEKLAYLYLSLDDHQQAETLFRRLLAEDEAPLGSYRRLSVNLGLAEALLGLAEPEAAQHYANEALPEIKQYEDDLLEARARMLLAESHLGLANTDENEVAQAIMQFERALGLYQQQNAPIWVTEIADRLYAITQDGTIDENQKEAARRVGTAVTEFTYPIRYRHPATVLFRHAVFIFLSIVIFILPLYSIRLDTGSLVSPAITFQGREFVLWPALIIEELDTTQGNPDADLASDAPAVGNTAAPLQFRPAVADAGLAVNAIPSTDTGVALQLGIGLLLGYVALSTGVGIAALVFTPLTTLQRAGRGRVRLNSQGLRVNDAEIAWADSTKMVLADLKLIREPLADDSAFALNSDTAQLIVPGNTTRYAIVRHRTASHLPAALPQKDWSYRLVNSRMGIWYIGTAALLTVLAFLGSSFPNLLNFDFPGTPYSLADLYPYLYLGLFVPPLWAFVLRPLQIRHQMYENSRLAAWIGLAGLFLLLLRLGSLFIPWFTLPDIYPSLGILLMVAGAVLAFWQTRLWPNKPRTYPNWVRWGGLLLGLFTVFVMGGHLLREVSSYHFLIVGNSLRDDSLLEDEPAAAEKLSWEAVAAYDRAIAIAQRKILGVVDTRAAVELLSPILRPTQAVWFQAQSNRAAVYMQLGDFATALADYDQLINFNSSTELLASRNLARLGFSTQANANSPDFQTILKEQGQLIATKPDNAYYRLWRGVTYHILGDSIAAEANYQDALAISGERALDGQSQVQAWTGLGWLAYGQNKYEAAVERFETAVSLNPNSDEAYLGLGFSYYSLREYDKALEAWQKTAELIPDDPTIYLSLGTLHWRLGMLQDGQSTLAEDRCADSNLSDEQKLASASELLLAIQNFRTAVSLPGRAPTDVATTYQSLARVQYLLRSCPGYDLVEVLKETIDSYSAAIELDPTNANYWHVRGRTSYGVWLNLPAGTGPSARVWLFDALDDTKAALALNPTDLGDYQPNRWRDLIYPRATDGSLAQGDSRFANGEYDVALGYYELVATRAPEVVRAPFKAGLASVALGDVAQAEVWYAEGLRRAEQADDASAVLLAEADLVQFAERSSADVTPLLDLLRDSEVEIDPADVTDAATAFALAQAALLDGRWQRAALLSNQGIELAVAARDIGVVREAGGNLAAFGVSYDNVNLMQWYWPLGDDVRARETAVAQLDRPDLYWRYRADYGFRLVRDLFPARPGWEASAARIYTQIVADVERAYALNPTEHQVWRDFYVDANLGWHYLRRGDVRVEAGSYADALEDYLQAAEIIQPNSENALNDLTETVFKVGLTALRLEEYELAQAAYDAGLTLLDRYDGNDAQLPRAIADLQTLLGQQQNPALARIAEPILEALEDAE